MKVRKKAKTLLKRTKLKFKIDKSMKNALPIIIARFYPARPSLSKRIDEYKDIQRKLTAIREKEDENIASEDSRKQPSFTKFQNIPGTQVFNETIFNPLLKTQHRQKQLYHLEEPPVILKSYKNKFIYARSLLHPFLCAYNLHEISNVMSSLWNDYTNCSASDYFMALTSCSRLLSLGKKDSPFRLYVRDHANYKVESDPCDYMLNMIIYIKLHTK